MGFVLLPGLLLGILVAIRLGRYYSIKKDDIFYCSLYGIIGLIIGAKLLYLLTNIPLLITNWEQIVSNPQLLLALFTGGFVFYGGVIGGVLGIYLYAKQFKLSFKNLLLSLIPCIPLVHTLGRIGCFAAGCCYGIEYDGFGAIVFTHSLTAPNYVPLFPVQLVESFLNLVIFAILLGTYKRFLNTYKTIGLYCILYSIVRFILEFLRGDVIRGFFLRTFYFSMD